MSREKDAAAGSTVDGRYYSSYFDLSVHKLMLDDEPRTEAYRDAILANKEAFQDKVVMGMCESFILVNHARFREIHILRRRCWNGYTVALLHEGRRAKGVRGRGERDGGTVEVDHRSEWRSRCNRGKSTLISIIQNRLHDSASRHKCDATIPHISALLRYIVFKL